MYIRVNIGGIDISICVCTCAHVIYAADRYTAERRRVAWLLEQSRYDCLFGLATETGERTEESHLLVPPPTEWVPAHRTLLRNPLLPPSTLSITLSLCLSSLSDIPLYVLPVRRFVEPLSLLELYARFSPARYMLLL